MLLNALVKMAFGFTLPLIVAAGAWGRSPGKPEHRIIPIHPMSEDVEILRGAAQQRHAADGAERRR